MDADSRQHLHIDLIGRFAVSVDEVSVPSEAWLSRRSAELVQLLALSENHRLARDQAIEALWPNFEVTAGAANLRKAAHYARKALGAPEMLVLGRGAVVLNPEGSVSTDLAEFVRLAQDVIRREDLAAASGLLDRFTGNLLPSALYEEWTQAARRSWAALRSELARIAQRWEDLVEMDPLDEAAYRELMEEAIASGNWVRAIQWYGRLRTVLATELSLGPSPETEALYKRCVERLDVAQPPMVGRQRELAIATSLLESGGGSEMRCLVLSGASGLGKTRLAGEVALQVSGREVFEARCLAPEQPYEPLIQIARGVMSAISQDRAPDIAHETFAELMVERNDRIPGVSRHRIVGALQRLVEALDRSAVLVIDDLHIADEATIDVLSRWLGITPPRSAFVVLTLDPEITSPRLKRTIDRLRRSGRALVLELEPLSDEDAAALVRQGALVEPSQAGIDRIIELADGNPAVTLELAQSLNSEGDLRVPSSVWEAALSWIDRFDTGEVAVLERLALTGHDLTTDEVLAVTQLDESDGYQLLDKTVQHSVLEVTKGRFRFRRELVRQALTRRVPDHRKLKLHRHLALRLGRLGHPSSEKVARHWLLGERPPEALPWLRSASRNAYRVGAFADCLRLADQYLEHDASNPDVLTLRADALAALGRHEAVLAYAEAITHLKEEVAEDVKTRMALTQLKSGDPVGALATLESTHVTTLAGRVREALTLSGAAALGFGEPDVAVTKAAEARRLALEIGQAEAVIETSWAQSLAAHARGDLQSDIRGILVMTAGSKDLALQVFDGYLCATERLLYGSYPYEEIVSFAESIGAEAERVGSVRGQGFARTLSGEARLMAGQLDQAEVDLDEAVRLNRRIGATAGEALALQRRAEVERYREEPSSARQYLMSALEVARESYLAHHLLDRIYGSLIAVAEEPDRAAALVEEAERAVRGPLETCPACRIFLEVPAAIAASRALDLRRAHIHANGVELLSSLVMPQPAWKAAASEVRGHLALAEGDADAARSHFVAAAERFQVAGHPIDARRCRQLAPD